MSMATILRDSANQRCPRAYVSTNNTASHDNHEKTNILLAQINPIIHLLIPQKFAYALF